MATSVRDKCVGEDETILDAARKMRARNVDALPICSEDNRLRGVLTERDIVVRVLAAGKDPRLTRVAELVDGPSLALHADDSAARGLQAMVAHQVRRLPVVVDDDLLGVVSQDDLASALGSERVSEFVAAA